MKIKNVARKEERLAYVRAELTRLETERYEPLWRENVRLAELICYWEKRMSELKARLAELRRRGWARLKASERREYLHIDRVEEALDHAVML